MGELLVHFSFVTQPQLKVTYITNVVTKTNPICKLKLVFPTWVFPNPNLLIPNTQVVKLKNSVSFFKAWKFCQLKKIQMIECGCVLSLCFVIMFHHNCFLNWVPGHLLGTKMVLQGLTLGSSAYIQYCK